jgi:hypothetical protein
MIGNIVSKNKNQYLVVAVRQSLEYLLFFSPWILLLYLIYPIAQSLLINLKITSLMKIEAV